MGPGVHTHTELSHFVFLDQPLASDKLSERSARNWGGPPGMSSCATSATGMAALCRKAEERWARGDGGGGVRGEMEMKDEG